MNYRRSILKFLANKNEKKLFLCCINDYYRKLIHQFCETQDLFHETERPDKIRKIKICLHCKYSNVIITFPCPKTYRFVCQNCKFSSSNLIQKNMNIIGVLITKK